MTASSALLPLTSVETDGRYRSKVDLHIAKAWVRLVPETVAKTIRVKV